MLPRCAGRGRAASDQGLQEAPALPLCPAPVLSSKKIYIYFNLNLSNPLFEKVNFKQQCSPSSKTLRFCEQNCHSEGSVLRLSQPGQYRLQDRPGGLPPRFAPSWTWRSLCSARPHVPLLHSASPLAVWTRVSLSASSRTHTGCHRTHG